jgi:glycosyltransferase involved in cell wall biosynthesis
MRTLHVDTELVWRGGQQQVLFLVEGLARLGVGVGLAAPESSALYARARQAGVAVEPFSARNDGDPVAAFRLAHLLRRHPCEILHCHTARAHAVGLLACRLLPRSSRPKIVISRRVAFSASSFLTRRKFRNADRVIAVSQAVKEGLVAAGVDPARIAVIRDGVRADDTTVDPAERERVRRLFHLAPSDRLVLHLAHLGAEKGQRDLIAAASRICAAVPDAHIAIVGGGKLRERLEREAAASGTAHILFVGFWPPEHVPALLAAASVFVLPSRQEGLGSVLLQAMAAGLPVVATAVGGIPEIVRDGSTGLLVPPRDSAALAAAVVRVLTDSALADRLAAAGLAFARKEGSAARMVEETLAVYRELFS